MVIKKCVILREVALKENIHPEQVIAVGDGANDIEMVGAAGLGVAFHAKPVLALSAAVRVDYSDLTALLYLQGYRASEIKE